MDNANKAKMVAELKADEGQVKRNGKHVVYKDHLGFDTLAIGRLVDRRRGGGLSDAEAEYLLINDIEERDALLRRVLPFYAKLDAVRQRALLNMAFQLGVAGLLDFKQMLAALAKGLYQAAAKEALDSDWAKLQTPARAKRVAYMIETGKTPA